MATRVLLTPSVLLVNDALDEREMYARGLRADGYHAISTENSVAANQIAVTRAPDIVVTDVRINGSLNGLELTRRLRNNERTSAVRIIVLTSMSRPHDADVALKAGADMFLEKPVPESALKVEIARLLAMSRRLLSEQAPRPHCSTTAARDLAAITTVATTTRSKCPSCDGTVIYRERWPVLASNLARAAIGIERMRYVSGWFCTNASCVLSADWRTVVTGHDRNHGGNTGHSAKKPEELTQRDHLQFAPCSDLLWCESGM